MLEASPLPASPLAAGYAVSIWAGQELWGTWWLVRAAGSAAAQPVTCSSPLKAGKCSVETTPPPRPPNPEQPVALAPQGSTLLSFPALTLAASLFILLPSCRKGHFLVPGSFCLRQEFPRACSLWKFLTKENPFPFKSPSFFLCFCHLTLQALELCLSSKLPVKPGNSEENVDESDLGPCDCPLSLLLVCR